MEEKKLKINIPEGYEIDKEKSTFEEIVFKKVEDPFSKLPKTWEEYYKRTKCYTSYYGNPRQTNISKTRFDGFYNEFLTEERVKQYVSFGKLLQLRDYWVKDYSEFRYAVYGDCLGTTICDWHDNIHYPLTFPTKEMAEKFIECFGDLIKQAYPLV